MRVTPGSCPYCGLINRETEAITGQDGAKPGDVMICEGCANFGIYEGRGAVRKPTPYERAALLEDPTIAMAVMQAELELL